MGRPKGIIGRPKSIQSQFNGPPRLITPEQAKELVESMEDKQWTYPEFKRFLDKSMMDSMQIMNELIHYGLMKVAGKMGKYPYFEKMTEDDEW